CPPSISGQHGHDAAMWAARVLVWGFNLPIDAARGLFKQWNQTCKPPWSDEEIEHKLKEANEKPFDKARGWLLTSTAPFSAPPFGTTAAQPQDSTCVNLAVLLDDPAVLKPPPRIPSTY